MADPYSKDAPGVADPANNCYEIETGVVTVGVKALRIANLTDEWQSLVVQTVVGGAVVLDIPPNCVWIEPLRIQNLLSATNLTVHGYTDSEGPPTT